MKPLHNSGRAGSHGEERLNVKIFCHSIISDWNHGNAHFLRGIVLELQSRGYRVDVYEPQDSWSLANLIQDSGASAIDEFRFAFPGIRVHRYCHDGLKLDYELQDADLVLVHEWNDPSLVRAIGKHHSRRSDYVLLFHDTHHRALTDKDSMSRYDLSHYDGVLTFGKVLVDIYTNERWTTNAWVWHEAADTRTFFPRSAAPQGDLIWIGNWGDEERTEELQEFLIQPSRDLGLKTVVYGVRYPEHAIRHLRESGIEYRGYLPNHLVPEKFAGFRATMHIPRRPYTKTLKGIPTIRPFEAMACGIPLLSAPWNDAEQLFRAGRDLLFAKDGSDMRNLLHALLRDTERCERMRTDGLETIRTRHTCEHRVNELLKIYRSIKAAGRSFEKTTPFLTSHGNKTFETQSSFTDDEP